MALTPEEQAELDELENDSDVQGFLNPVASAPEQKGIDASAPEAFVRGAAQELTFGAADEITGGLAGVKSTLSGGTYKEAYDKALAESRAEYAFNEEEHPVASLLGGMAGGVGQAVGLSAVTGGAGGVAKAGSLLSKAGALAKGAIMPSAGKSVAGHIGKMAASGAVVGGLNAVGRSEKEGLDRIEDVPGGAASGAAFGGAFGAVGGGVGKAGQFISKKIDSGDAPYFAKMIRNAYRAGKEGIGFSNIASKLDVENKGIRAADNAVSEIVKNLDEMRDVREVILKNTPDIISVVPPVTILRNTLQGLSTSDDQAADFLKKINKEYSIRTGKTGSLSVASANQFAGVLDTMLGTALSRTNAVPSAPLSKAMGEAIKGIKAEMRLVVDDKKALEVLEKYSPESIPLFKKHTSELSDSSVLMSEEISDQEKKSIIEANRIWKNLKATYKRKNGVTPPPDSKGFKQTIANLKKPEKAPKVKGDEIPKDEVSEFLRIRRDMNIDAASASPLAKLDSGMHNILNASEILGGVTSARSPSDKIDNYLRMFRNMMSQSKDSTSGQSSTERYFQAMEQLKKANPILADKVETIVQKPIALTEIKKYIEGASFGEAGVKDTSIVKAAMAIPGSILAGSANILGQVQGAANIGARGPIPMATSTLRPAVSTLSSIKEGVEGLRKTHPNSPMLGMISESIDRALAEKDEGRRAAVLNTLMQYKTFRDMFSINKEEEATSGEE